jgi:hypothetical protein
VFGGSALGGRHVTTGAPNQDAWGTETIVRDDEEHVIMAVADGHGGSRYVRSDVGSKLAVSVAIEVVREAVELGVLDGPTRKVEKALADLPANLVATWSKRCLEHLAQHPFTSEEEARAGEPVHIDPLLSYGSTILIGILSPNRCFLLQLGDGDSLVALDNGRMVQPLPADDRLTGSETTSLCLPDAERDFRVATVENPVPTLVVLSTDGYGVAFADPEWRQSVVSDLLNQLRNRGPGQVQAALPKWLEESATVGGDDATLAMAYRPDARESRGVLKRSKIAPMVGIGVIGVLIGGLGGWAVANGFAGQAPAVGPVSTLAGTTTTDVTTTTLAVTSTTGDGDVGAGGGVSQGEQVRASIIGADGTVVEFYPDPKSADAAAVESVGTPEASMVAFAWGSYWAIEEGRLFADGEQYELGLDTDLLFAGVEYENGFIWAVTDDGNWLVALGPESVCVLPILAADADDSQEPASPAPDCSPLGDNGE